MIEQIGNTGIEIMHCQIIILTNEGYRYNYVNCRFLKWGLKCIKQIVQNWLSNILENILNEKYIRNF